jgi:drug/metabolite transporter (DMT)-like permease
VVLTVYKKNDKKDKSWLYPLLLFVLLGLADSLVKYMQTHHIKDMQSTSLFAATLFTVSSFLGIIIWSFYGPDRKLVFKPLVLLSGLGLGVVNFGSLYFLVNALNSLNINSSIVFGINNLGIVVLSVAIAVIGYKEKLLTINKIGILISIIVVGLMMLSF